MARYVFEVSGGAKVTVGSESHPVHTLRGVVQADEVVQGDHICYATGQPYVEVVSPPTTEE